MAPRDPDPHGEEKERYERRLARNVAKFFREQRGRLAVELSLQSGMPTLPGGNFWEDENHLLAKVLQADLQAIANRFGNIELGEIFRRKQVDPGGILEEAIKWAVEHAATLSAGINATTSKTVIAGLAEFFNTPGFTIGDLIDKLGPTFGPVRAQAIAVTEITRAAARGQSITTGLIRDEGYLLEEVWNTNNDGLVCPICAPRHRQKRGTVWSDDPPAHVNCRCWVTTRIADVQIEEQEIAPPLIEQGATAPRG